MWRPPLPGAPHSPTPRSVPRPESWPPAKETGHTDVSLAPSRSLRSPEGAPLVGVACRGKTGQGARVEQGQRLDTQSLACSRVPACQPCGLGFAWMAGGGGRLSPPSALHCHLCLLLSIAVFLFVQPETTRHPVAPLRTQGPCLRPQVSACWPCGRRPHVHLGQGLCG